MVVHTLEFWASFTLFLLYTIYVFVHYYCKQWSFDGKKITNNNKQMSTIDQQKNNYKTYYTATSSLSSLKVSSDESVLIVHIVLQALNADTCTTAGIESKVMIEYP